MDLELEIEGMRCAACAQTIEKALAKEPGVARASVNLALSRARVEVDPGVASPDKVIAAVRAAGYGARPALDLARAAEDELSAARRDRVELGLTALAAVPVAVVEHVGAHGSSAVLGAVATLAVLLGGRAFFVGALRAARARTPNMDVLVATGALAAISWSWLALLRPEFQLGHHLSFGEAALLVLFVRTGKALEGRARTSAREALVALVSREPRNAMLRSGGVVPVASLAPGDEVVIRPGETVAVDGIIIDGSSSFDEALLTGESVPRERGAGDGVAGGTVNLGRVVTVRAVRTGEDTALRKIARLVLDAQAEKAPIQRFADKAASVFVPAVLVLATATGLVWKLALGAPLAVALARAVAVLVVACPCALGLATPVAVLVGSGAALRRGILVRSAAALEGLGRVSVLLLDKTGTLTVGKPRVVHATGDPEALGWAAALEARSTHPLARAVAASRPPSGTIEEQEELAGLGVRGRVSGHEVLVGSAELLSARGIAEASLDGAPEGATLVHVAVSGREVAQLALRDEPRPEAREALERVRRLGIQLAVLSGDRRSAVSAVARDLGIEDFDAELGPAEKLSAISRWKGRTDDLVAMCGDGINDAPALARADVGIALGAGTDVAREAGSVVLLRDDLRALAEALELGRRVLRKIRQNLALAVVYNVIGIPLAAGALSQWGVELTPALAGLAMALSSASVVANALLLRR